MGSLRFILLTLLLILLSSNVLGKNSSLPKGPKGWEDEARRFTGESEEAREQAIEHLKAIPGLTTALRTELEGRNKFLAFDVISTLKLDELLPDLLRVSEFDDSGFSYQAINGLIARDNQARIAQIYLERLTSERSSRAARVILLDTLARMRKKVPVHHLRNLISDSSFEVRASALRYLRAALIRGSQDEYFRLLEEPLAQGPYQLKLQALYLISELSPEARKRVLPYLAHCQGDSNSDVKALCARLSRSPHG